MNRWVALVLIALAACLPACSRGLARGCYVAHDFEPYPPEPARVTVTRQDAIRLAAEYGLEEGVAPWRVSLRGATWRIETILFVRPDGLRGGRTMDIDGFTGELVEVIGWDEQSSAAEAPN